MKKWQIENSEISEILFQAFSSPSFWSCSIAKIENLEYKSLEKSFREFRGFRFSTLACCFNLNSFQRHASFYV